MQKEFDIHEAMLTSRSSFFKAALSGDWAEAKDRVVKLPQDEPAVFQSYTHFLYTDILCVEPKTPAGNDGEYGERITILKFYVLAEKLQDMKAKRAAIEAMIYYLWDFRRNPTKFPGLECIRIVYDGTPANSPMRHLLLDFFASRADTITFEKDVACPREFLQELVITLFEKRQKPADLRAMFKEPEFYMGASVTPKTLK